MTLDRQALTVIVAAIALQAAVAQGTGVSMKVIDGTGPTAGLICEPFDCVPHQLGIGSDSTIVIEMYGLADQPYILFAGPPGKVCLQLPWVLGGVTMQLPVSIVDVGLVPASGLPGKCGMDTATFKLELPAGLPPGAAVVLQTAAWPLTTDMPAFSRGVQLTVL